MARRMRELQRRFAKLHRPDCEWLVDGDWADVPVERVQPNRNAEASGDLYSCADMIGMAMGGDDGDGFGAMSCCNNEIGICCSIDDERCHRELAGNDVGIVAKGPHLGLANRNLIIFEVPGLLHYTPIARLLSVALIVVAQCQWRLIAELRIQF